jgi:hypothetical protein
MPKVLILRERPGSYPDQAFPAEFWPAPPSRSSMPILSMPPDQKTGLHCTDQILSALCIAIFKLLMASWNPPEAENDREHFRTIENTPERRSRVYWIIGRTAIRQARPAPSAYSSHPAPPARCIVT